MKGIQNNIYYIKVCLLHYYNIRRLIYRYNTQTYDTYMVCIYIYI